jgi:hypothetical protein
MTRNKTSFEFKTFSYDIRLNHHLFLKIKLIKNYKFNHLINALKFPYVMPNNM